MKEAILLFVITIAVLVIFVAIMTWRAKRHPGNSGCGYQHHHNDNGCQCGDNELSKVTILEQMPPKTP